MPAVESQMLPLGAPLPDFSLPDPDGSRHSAGEGYAAYLVMFICNHCPFVRHIREELARLGDDYGARNVRVLAINSNDIERYPDDGPAEMRRAAREWGYAFPYVLDADQAVAKRFKAACTPDFYVFNADHRLVYRGQLDDSRPSNGRPVDGRDLRAALDAVLAGRPVSDRQLPSVGCSIKWQPGNEPDYAR